MKKWLALMCGVLGSSSSAYASEQMTHATLDALRHHWGGAVSLAIFVIAYMIVMTEERIHMRKSKPVIVAAGIIWVMVALAFAATGQIEHLHAYLDHNILEFAYLFLFLLSAMTYINVMTERNVFEALRGWLVSRGFSLRQIFWVTGLLAFFISPVADNLTTALLMAAVVMAVAPGDYRFISLSCVNIVVAANAGGAFSPFGDITTLMVWQKGIVQFHEFFALFVPSLISWVVPAAVLSLGVERICPTRKDDDVEVKQGGFVVMGLFIMTIALAVSFHNYLHLPPALGMMTGLGVLKLYGYLLKRIEIVRFNGGALSIEGRPSAQHPFDIFAHVRRAEWDTLMFFYGVILCVGGLGAFGYLTFMADASYGAFGPLTANIMVGVVSAIVDNIPVMFAVLTMQPEMDHTQWLLVTLTAGIGGSLLSIGSAAGVALMGQAHGVYTFFSHLKWTPIIAIGYALGIWAHLMINGGI